MDKSKTQAEAPPPKPKIPEELVCSLCQDLLTDALLVPCCANSYCDDCESLQKILGYLSQMVIILFLGIRNALLNESADNECPGCHEKDISPSSLIPNRFLRTAVNAFKNETGYSKPQKMDPPKNLPTTVDLTDSKERTRTLSLDDLPEDLFPHSPRKVEEDEEKKAAEADKEPDTAGKNYKNYFTKFHKNIFVPPFLIF